MVLNVMGNNQPIGIDWKKIKQGKGNRGCRLEIPFACNVTLKRNMYIR